MTEGEILRGTCGLIATGIFTLWIAVVGLVLHVWLSPRRRGEERRWLIFAKRVAKNCSK